MKHIFSTLILFMVVSSVFAQDSIRIENYYHDGTVYDIFFKNAEGQRQGPYLQYSRFGKKYVEGQYNNGLPVGIWNYFSSDTSGTLVQILNFDTHQETFVDSNRVTSLICGPRYFGGRVAKNEYVARRIESDFTSEEKANYKGMVYVLSFSIDPKTMKVTGVSVDDQNLPETMKAKMYAIANEMPAWLPPVCKDKSEVWRFSIGISFQ
ncbi:hypothetical protein BH09BAC5_BH09BAC5_12250 [soil metagenome]